MGSKVRRKLVMIGLRRELLRRPRRIRHVLPGRWCIEVVGVESSLETVTTERSHVASSSRRRSVIVRTMPVRVASPRHLVSPLGPTISWLATVLHVGFTSVVKLAIALG
jgi:hypothetical protein